MKRKCFYFPNEYLKISHPRPPVTWCPRGIMRRTWSWTRRLRLSAGRMKLSWRGTRWEEVFTYKKSFWDLMCGACNSFSFSNYFIVCRRWRRTGKEQKKKEWHCRAGRAKPMILPSQSASPLVWVSAKIMIIIIILSLIKNPNTSQFYYLIKKCCSI